MIRTATPDDAAIISEIYNHYIKNTVITFEEDEVSASEIRQRMLAIKEDKLPWLMAEDQGQVIGYAYASKWKERCAYRYSVEVTVYLCPSAKKKGWGSRLYQTLFERLKEMDIHVVIGGITLPNPASITLHEKFGMEKVAHFKEVGYKFKQWLDVGYWQLSLSRFESDKLRDCL